MNRGRARSSKPSTTGRSRDAAAADDPATLVCAPGGSGKTTLLVQLAARAADGASVVWISIDEDDDDANRLFATLVHGLEPLQLAWETDPQELVRRVAGSGTQSRAALATLVNALCTSVAPRILIVLDDLHRIGRPDAFALQAMSEDQWLSFARVPRLPPMPWFNLRDMSDADLRAMYRYIRSLGAAGGLARPNAPPGGRVRTPVVVFVPQGPAQVAQVAR